MVCVRFLFLLFSNLGTEKDYQQLPQPFPQAKMWNGHVKKLYYENSTLRDFFEQSLDSESAPQFKSPEILANLSNKLDAHDSIHLLREWTKITWDAAKNWAGKRSKFDGCAVSRQYCYRVEQTARQELKELQDKFRKEALMELSNPESKSYRLQLEVQKLRFLQTMDQKTQSPLFSRK